jgi:hypothetical protein
MPQPTVFPHNVMQGSILTDTQMPQPTVFPHNVMQGTKNFEYGQAPAGQRFFEYGQAPAGQRNFQYGQAPAGQQHFQYGQAPAGQKFFQYGNAPSGQAHWSYGDPDGGMGRTAKKPPMLNIKYTQTVVDKGAQKNGIIYVNGVKSGVGFINLTATAKDIDLPLIPGHRYTLVVVYASGAKSLPLTIDIPTFKGLPRGFSGQAIKHYEKHFEKKRLVFELDVRTIPTSRPPAHKPAPLRPPVYVRPPAHKPAPLRPPVYVRPKPRPTAPPVSVEDARKKPLAEGTHHIGVAKITYSQIVSEPRVQWDGDIYLNGKFSGSGIRDNRPVGAPLTLVKGANILIVKYKSGAVSLPVSVILNDATLKAIKLGKFVPIRFQLDPHSVKPSMLKGPAVKPPPTPPVGAPPIACSPPVIRPPVKDTPPGMPPANRWDDEPVAFLSGNYDTVGQLPGMNAPVIGVDMAGRILVNATNIIPFLASNLAGSGTRMSACTPQPDGKIWVYFDSPRFEVTRPASGGREELIRFDCGTPTGYLSDIESKISSYPLDSNKWPAEALAQFKQDSRTYESGVQSDAGPDLTWAGYKNPTLAYLMVAQACAMMAAKQVVEGVLVSPGGPSLPTEPEPVPVAVAEQVAAHDIADVAIAKTAEIAITTNQVTGDSTPVTEVEKVETKVEEVKDAAEANNVAPEVAEKVAEDAAVAAPKDLKEAVAVAKEVAKEEAVVAKEEAAVAKEEIAVKEAAAAPAEKKGKGGLVMLLAAATGVYFLTKG